MGDRWDPPRFDGAGSGEDVDETGDYSSFDGESGAVEEHECLDVASSSPPEEAELASEEEEGAEEEEVGEESVRENSQRPEEDARPMIGQERNEDKWQEKDAAMDREEPASKVASGSSRPERSSSRRTGNHGAPIRNPVRVSQKIPVSESEKDAEGVNSTPQNQGGTSSEKSINILLLGETGVGKSTFINALCNYLKFPTLDEAQQGEMESLIFSEFVTANEEGDEITIAVGTPDEDEGGKNKAVGSSCTQRCKAYSFPIFGEKIMRLIDSPGIGDTRGPDQDMINIKNIISFISRYDALNAICILLKPNQERLTLTLKYCVLELLAHLHKDASRNILFCFTNSRSTFFRVGGTKRLLVELLSQAPQTAAIKLEKDTMFHFDSEGFRFLACVKNDMTFTEIETGVLRSSWKQSSDEACRLICHIASLTPHDIQSTLSLNRVRDFLTTIEDSLVAISKVIQSNIDNNREVMKGVFDEHGNIQDKWKLLIRKEDVLEMHPIGHGRTICSSSKCKGRICHEHCSHTETLAGGFLGYFSGEAYVFCKKLSLRKQACRECQCPINSHSRVTLEQRIVVRETEDKDVRAALDKAGDKIQQMKDISAVYDLREKELEKEMQIVVNAAAKFVVFLDQNSIITYHPATKEYLQDQIKKRKALGDEASRIKELESLLESYEKEVENFRKRCVTSGSGTIHDTPLQIGDVKEELDKLYALPQNGEALRKSADDVMSKYISSPVMRLDEVAVPIPHTAPTRKGANPTKPKGLLEKIGLHTHKQKPGDQSKKVQRSKQARA